MSYLYLLAGENLKLAEKEVKGFLRSQGKDEATIRTSNLVETPEEPSQLKRLALTHEVSEKIGEYEKVEEIDYRPEKSFAVRKESLEETNAEEIEEKLGECLSSKENSVDLEEPEEIIKAYITEEKIILGKKILDIDRGLFEKRKNQNRPFSSPVSLDPILARTLVNLSGVKPGEHILDPFCGTGGILIEAGLCGVGVHGLDLKEEMVSGCRKNLEEYGIINHDISQKDISEINKEFLSNFNTVITDLPYGKSSKKTEDAIEEFLNLIDDYEKPAVFVWDEPSIGGYEHDHSIYIHGSLTRYIYALNT